MSNKSQAFIVEGGHKLSGEITPQGAKNEALQVICAVLLTSEKVTLSNLPDIVDVRMLIDLIKGLGVKVESSNPNTYTFEAANINLKYLESKEFVQKASRIRGSVMLIGPLLARFGRAILPKPGGDKIGRRRLDTHLLGLQKLGADFKYDVPNNMYTIGTEGLKGTYILMDEISVTGTANTLMAAAMAEGMTTIYNAACEPYLQQLCKMLNSMGARIMGVGSNKLIIEGVSKLYGTGHRCLPDMIEIGSFMGLAAMTQSEITIKNVRVDMLGNILPMYRRMGIQFEVRGDDIYVPAQDLYEIQTFIDGSVMNIYDSPWPGFPPDLMSILLVIATQAKGAVLIHQKMLVYRLAEDKCSDGERAYMLVVNASNMKKDWDWISQHNTFDAELTDISDMTSLLAVQGPKATATLQALTDMDLASMKYYTFEKGKFAGLDNVLISATGYTGSGGFEIYVSNNDAAAVWDAVLEAGKEHGIKPIGLGARDTLRLEMGFCLYGNDIDDTTSPLEAGLGWITKLAKDDFIDKEFLVNQKAAGVSKKLVGFEVLDKRPPRQGYDIVNAAGEVIGKVTSGTKAPSLGIPIGMGYVQKEYSKKETQIFIDVRGKKLEAKVVRPPFYKAK